MEDSSALSGPDALLFPLEGVGVLYKLNRFLSAAL